MSQRHGLSDCRLKVRDLLCLPLLIVGEPLPVKEINPLQRCRTIPENQYRTQSVCRIINIL